MKPERLSPLDSSYLSMDGPVTVGHVCLICLLDGVVSLDELRRRVQTRIHRVPALRRRLQTTLVGLGRPWWVDDPEFDLEAHLFEVTLSGAGDDLEMSKHVARISTGRLNRAHPLWEFHLIQGLRNGSTALVMKIHHAVMDGIGVRDLLDELFGEDGTPDIPAGQLEATIASQHPEQDWSPGPWPSELQLVVQSIQDTQGWLGTVARIEYRATAGLVQGAEKAVGGLLGGIVGGVGGLVGGVSGVLGLGAETTEVKTTEDQPHPNDILDPAPEMPATVGNVPDVERTAVRSGADHPDAGPVGNANVTAALPPAPMDVKPARSWWTVAPESILNGPVSAARSWAFASRSIGASRSARHHTVTTVNDLVIASAAGGLRAWLLEAGALPDEPLVAMIPMGGRTVPGREEVGANKLALTLCLVPTDVADPLERLYAAHDAMVSAKSTPSMGEALLEDLTRVTSPGLTNLTVEAFYWLHLATRVRFPYNLIITNVPGPRYPLSLGGHAFTGLYPCPPLSDTMGLNLAAHGYHDRLCFGVSACPNLLPDVHHLMDLIMTSHDELVQTVEAAAADVLLEAEPVAGTGHTVRAASSKRDISRSASVTLGKTQPSSGKTRHPQTRPSRTRTAQVTPIRKPERRRPLEQDSAEPGNHLETGSGTEVGD